MPSRRVFAVLAVLFVVGTACSGDEVKLPEASRTPATTITEPTGSTGPEPGAQPPASGASLASVACSMPHEWLLRTWRGNSEDRSAEIQILPIEPNYVGSGLPHVGPWDYAQDIPMFWYGPGHIAPAGQVERPVTLAGIAPTAAQLLGFPFRAIDGSPMTEAIAGNQTPPRLLVTMVWDAGGRNVLERWRNDWPYLRSLIPQGAWYEHATVGTSPTSTAQTHATIGTGAFPDAAPDRGAQAPDRPRPHHALGEGSRVPDGADARGPVRPGDGQRAGRGRGRDREHPPGDARPRLDVGRRRPGHRRDPREDRGGHARRRGFGLEPLVRTHAVLPVPRVREPGRRVRQGRAGGGRERRAARRPVADQRHRGAPAGVRHAGTDPVPDPRDRGDDPARGVRRRRHARPAVRELQDDRLHQPRVDREQPGDAGRREGAGRGARRRSWTS